MANIPLQQPYAGSHALYCVPLDLFNLLQPLATLQDQRCLPFWQISEVLQTYLEAYIRQQIHIADDRDEPTEQALGRCTARVIDLAIGFWKCIPLCLILGRKPETSEEQQEAIINEVYATHLTEGQCFTTTCLIWEGSVYEEVTFHRPMNPADINISRRRSA